MLVILEEIAFLLDIRRKVPRSEKVDRVVYSTLVITFWKEKKESWEVKFDDEAEVE